MTCGIYILNFDNTNKVYIGQSVCIEKRYSQHLLSFRNNTASPKLLEGVSKYGIPSYTILLECDLHELDENEEAAISVWDSVINGFNTYTYANEAPSNMGQYGSGNTKYSKSSIIKVFELLVNTECTYVQVASISKVPESTVSTIASLKSHIWLKAEFPDQYDILIKKLATRKLTASNVVSNKLSAKSRGIIYPTIKDPQGTIYTIDNAYRFAKEHGLAPNHFQEVLNGHRKSHKGWKVCPEEVQ